MVVPASVDFTAIFTPSPRATTRAWDKVTLSKVVDQHRHNIMHVLVLQVDHAISRGGRSKKLCRPCWRRTERTGCDGPALSAHGRPSQQPHTQRATPTSTTLKWKKTKPSVQNSCLAQTACHVCEWNSHRIGHRFEQQTFEQKRTNMTTMHRFKHL